MNSLENVSDEVNDDDQEVQPQTENPDRKKQKKQKKENTYRTSLSKFTKNTWPRLKDQKKDYGKNDTRTKRAGQERNGKRQDIFS